jgi:hypothetical protein
MVTVLLPIIQQLYIGLNETWKFSPFAFSVIYTDKGNFDSFTFSRTLRSSLAKWV